MKSQVFVLREGMAHATMEPEDFAEIVKKKKPPPRPPPPNLVDDIRKTSCPRLDTSRDISRVPRRPAVLTQKTNLRPSGESRVIFDESSRQRSKSANCLVSVEELEKQIHSLSPMMKAKPPPHHRIPTPKPRNLSKSQESINRTNKPSPQKQKSSVTLEHKMKKSSKPSITGPLHHVVRSGSGTILPALAIDRPSSTGPNIRPPPVKLDLTSKSSYVNRPAPPKPQPVNAQKEETFTEDEVYTVPDHFKPNEEDFIILPYAEFNSAQDKNKKDDDQSCYIKMKPSVNTIISTICPNKDEFQCMEVNSSFPTIYMPLIHPETSIDQNSVAYTGLRSRESELYDVPNKSLLYQHSHSSQEGYLALSGVRDEDSVYQDLHTPSKITEQLQSEPIYMNMR